MTENCITCPRCKTKNLDHEQENPEWEHCKFYCYNCELKVTWKELVELLEGKTE